MIGNRRVACAVSAAWLACGSSLGVLPGGPGGSARNVVVPIYLRGSEVLSGVVQIEQARTEHARRLFFRIGALPSLALSGVQVTVCDASRGEELIEEAGRRLAALAKGKAIEIRGMKVFHRAGSGTTLAAEWARIHEEGFWELRGVALTDESGTVAAAEGRVWLAGEKAGSIELKRAEGLVVRRLTSSGSKTDLQRESSPTGL